jgi:Flp pilus assembly protein TadB
MRKLRWGGPASNSSKHRVRDTALVYAFFAGLLVVITAVTGGSIVKGVVAGAVVFAAAMVYSWWRWRTELRRQEGGEE